MEVLFAQLVMTLFSKYGQQDTLEQTEQKNQLQNE